MDFTPGHCAAFPRPVSRDGNDCDHDSQEGLTAREWFAGQALAGLVTSRAPGTHDMVARNAFALADAMLAEARRKHDEAQAERMKKKAASLLWFCRNCLHATDVEDFCEPEHNAACPLCRNSDVGPVAAEEE